MTAEAAFAAALPLFPLQTVLFPGGLLELKVFEARYLDLMSLCMRTARPFGVVGLRSGSEARVSNDAVSFHEVGTLAELIDVDSARPGILLVRCRGAQRFALGASRQQADGLWVGDASPMADDPAVAPRAGQAAAAKHLADVLEALAAQGARPALTPHRFDDAGWVANRWCELMPWPLQAKQRLMALADPLARLEIVDSLMRTQVTEH